MKRVLITFIVALCLHSSAFASQSKDILYRLAREYDVEMWKQGENGNPTFAMNMKGYEFYFKHLYHTYKDKYKTLNANNDVDGYYGLYKKVCGVLDWKVKNKQYNRLKKYIRLKKKIETSVKALESQTSN